MFMSFPTENPCRKRITAKLSHDTLKHTAYDDVENPEDKTREG